MQLSYHAYTFREPKTTQHWRIDLRPFLQGYLKWDNVKFKNSFTHGGESVFMLPYVGDVLLFVQARDHEIIKKIERSTLAVSELQDMLRADDSIGFAAFVYLQADYLAMASTVRAPRVGTFNSFLNKLLQKLDIDLAFETRAMTYTLPRSAVVKLDRAGAFSMRVRPENGLFRSIAGSLGLGDREDLDLGSMEITIRPARKGADTRPALIKALDNVEGKGLESFDARAKVDAADKMADIFIVGQGGIRDPINTRDPSKIVAQITEAAAGNTVLEERLREFRADANVAHADNPDELGLAWPPASLAAVDRGKMRE